MTRGSNARALVGSFFVVVLLGASGCEQRANEGAPRPSATATSAVRALENGSGGAGGAVVAPEQASSCPSPMALVPGGAFWVGSEKETYEREENPRFRAAMGALCVDPYEVGTAEYEGCMKSGACTAPASTGKTCNTVDKGRGEHPINCVDHAQATAYCNARAARLPSELEWEYLARGGAAMLKYPWGDAEPDGHLCWKWHQSCERGKFGAGAFGLYDVVGNVWEWTDSWFAPYPWPAETGRHRVLRGASWSRRFDKWLSPTLRNRAAPDTSGSHLGLRCVRDLPGGSCPGPRDESGRCAPVIERVECLDGLVWNGVRCASPGVAGCAKGSRAAPGRGCVAEVSPSGAAERGERGEERGEAGALDLLAVSRARSPEFDDDCRTNQPQRPVAYRFSGGEHLARNAVVKGGGCKNRDVGVGWNSACCPVP